MIIQQVPLFDIAHARSGDKGRDANIGVIAYTEEGYSFLKENLTEEKIKNHFSSLDLVEVKCYLMPGISALNFVLKGALGQGASRSLRLDAQGKALGAALLELKIAIPEELYMKCQRIKP